MMYCCSVVVVLPYSSALEAAVALEQVAQRDCGVSSGEVPNLPGHCDPRQPALGDIALAGLLD